MTGLSACGLWDSIVLGGPPFLAQSRLTAVNWLWVLGGIVAVWILISAMARRQTRLTGVLRAHVERHKEAHKPPEIEEKPNE
ncbi:hypothetical protein [Neorhodopirellula pilleata]|nr:hypothetical protein [Neorhodopirellula pilleata]